MCIFVPPYLSFTHVRELLHGCTHILNVAAGLILRATPFSGVVASREEGECLLVFLLRMFESRLLVYEAQYILETTPGFWGLLSFFSEKAALDEVGFIEIQDEVEAVHVQKAFELLVSQSISTIYI